tara:strand:+ start:3010 stop:13230 length:10221 start_codon:yes stop_codon:yes gene_type:complete
MSIFPTYTSPEELERIRSIGPKRNPTSNNPTGNEIDTWMLDGIGGEFKGNSFDLALLKASDPETFNTASLSQSVVLPTSQNDSAMNGVFGANTSTDLATNLLAGRRKEFEKYFTEKFSDLDSSVVSRFGASIFNKNTAHKEWTSRSGTLGFTPTVPGDFAGEDNAFYRYLGFSRSYYRVAYKLAHERYNENVDPNRGLVSTIRSVLSGKEKQIPSEEKNRLILEELVRLKQAPKQLLENPNSEVAQAAVEASKDRFIFDESRNFSTTSFPILEQEATNRGLYGYALRVFVYNEAHKMVARDLNTLVNSDSTTNTAEKGAELLARIEAISEVTGFDFIHEAMQTIQERQEGWEDEAWDNLPESRQQILLENGFSKETFLRDSNGNLLASNRFTYANMAMFEAQRIAATSMREKLFETNFHEGWADWTRRLTDTLRIDVGGDPYAMYFIGGTVPTGIGAGVMFGSGSAAGIGTSIGARMAMTAADGLAAGLAEGYASSTAGQLNNMRSGVATDINWNHTAQNMALYGGMGAIAGGTLAGGMGAIGPMARGGKRISNRVSALADTVAAEGYFGGATAQRALNRMAERQATLAEIEGASILANIQNQGLAIRLNRGDVEAREVINEVLPGLVNKSADETTEMAEELFSASRLADYGISQSDVVDLVFGVQRMLGANSQLSAGEFDKIMRVFFMSAKKHAQKFLGETADGTAKRIAAIDAALKTGAKRQKANFVGGIGKGLTEAETVKLKKLTQRLKDSKVPGAQQISKKDMKQLMNLTRRINDEEVIQNMRKMINDENARRASAGIADRADEATLRVFNEDVNRAIKLGQKARKDSFFQKALDVEAALKLLRNERTITVAKELGVSAKRVLSFVDGLKEAVGDPDRLARYLAENATQANAINKIISEGGLEVLDGTSSSFNVSAFLKETQIVGKVREMQKLRQNMTKSVRKELEKTNLDSEALAKRISQVANKFREKYRALAKELGMDVDVDEAYEALVFQLTNDIPFDKLPSSIKANKLAEAITKLVDAQAPDAVTPGARDVDRGFIRTLYKGTGLSERLEKIMASISQWPLPQQRLFRSRERVVRGISNWITGQHVNNRVFSNTTDFMSIEALQEGALRAAMPYTNFSKHLRARLGGDANYRLFDRQFLYLRQRGSLTGEIDVSDLDETLIRVYDEIGGADALKKDLAEAQKLYTHFVSQAIEEANEAGIKLGGDPTRYIPNVIRGNLSEERAAQFVEGFVKAKQAQLLDGNAALDPDVLHSLGWIRVTTGKQVDAAGRTLKNKEFVVPENSPFWMGTDEASEAVARNVMKNGFSALKLLDSESATSPAGVSRSVGTGRQYVPILNDLGVEDAIKIMDDVAEITGSEMRRPVPMTSSQAGRAKALSKIITGEDEVTNTLESAVNKLRRMSETETEEYARVTGRDIDLDIENILDTLQNRRQAALNEMRRQMGDTDPNIRRLDISAEERIRLAQNREEFSALSDGHRALQNRLDNLIVEGLINEEAAIILRAAFVDIDPDQMIGMSFVKLGKGKLQDGTAGTAHLRRSIELASVEEGYGKGAENAISIASLFVHETSHLAFLSANPRMQGVFQSLLEQARAGNNNITKIFKQFGLNVDYALSDVHEFVAALSEIALIRNRFTTVTDLPDSLFETAMDYLKAFLKKLVGKIFFAEDSPIPGLPADMKQMIGEIEKAMKQMYNITGEVDDDVLGAIERRYGVTPAEEIDEYGGTLNEEAFAQAFGVQRSMGDNQPNFGRPKDIDDPELQKIEKELENTRQILKMMEEDPDSVAMIPDLEKTIRDLESQRDAIYKTLDTKNAAKASVEGDSIEKVTEKPKRQPSQPRVVREEPDTNTKRALELEALEKETEDSLEKAKNAGDEEAIEKLQNQLEDVRMDMDENVKARAEIKAEKAGTKLYPDTPEGRVNEIKDGVSTSIEIADANLRQHVRDLEGRFSNENLKRVRKEYGITSDEYKKFTRLQNAAKAGMKTEEERIQRLSVVQDNIKTKMVPDKTGKEYEQTGFFTARADKAKELDADTKLVYTPRPDESIDDFVNRLEKLMKSRERDEAIRGRMEGKSKREVSIVDEEGRTVDVADTRGDYVEEDQILLKSFDLQTHSDPEKAKAAEDVIRAYELRQVFDELAEEAKDPNKKGKQYFSRGKKETDAFNLGSGREARTERAKQVVDRLKEKGIDNISVDDVLKHNTKSGLLNYDNAKRLIAIVRESNIDEQANEVIDSAVSQVQVKRIETKLEEAANASPAIQNAIARISGGESVESVNANPAPARPKAKKKTTPEPDNLPDRTIRRLRENDINDEAIAVAEEKIVDESDLTPSQLAARQREVDDVAKEAAGDIPELPGYTRLTREELDAKVDSNDTVFSFLADDVQQVERGEGASYARELGEYFNLRKQAQAADEAPTETRRTGPQRLADGDDQDFRRPSDKELRARYEEEAQARLRAEEVDDESLFLNMQGPRPRTADELSDDELLELGSNLEAKLGRDGKLTARERKLYNRIRKEIDNRGGGGGKPPKTGRGAGDAGEPGDASWNFVEYLTERLKNISEEQTSLVDDAGDVIAPNTFNRRHRLHRHGSLADIYRKAVMGNRDVLDEHYLNELADAGLAAMPALERAGHDYIQHSGGGFKTTHLADARHLEEHINAIGSVSNMHRRTFDDSWIDGPGGDEIARLFADAGSSTDGIIRYAETTLASIRVQKALNKLLDSEGASMSDLFKQVRKSLEENIKARSDGSKRGSLTRAQANTIDRYMEDIMTLYLRARGITPRKDVSFSQASRITQNLAYSILGAKFAMSVLFAEAPLAVLRASGLNPFKMIYNTGVIGKGLLDAAIGSVGMSPTMSRWMAAMGIDTRLARETVEDLTSSLSAMRTNSMARFGSTSDESMENAQVMFTLMDRIRAHYNNIKGAWSGDVHMGDTTLTQRLADTVEAVTGSTADLTGIMSFMTPVTLAVKTVAENQAKGTLLKHTPGLIKLAQKLADNPGMTTAQLKGLGRELGLPRQIVVYAAESGLLSPNVLQRLIDMTGLTPESAGRELNLNALSDVIAGNRSLAMDGVSGLGRGFDTSVDEMLDVDSQIIPSLNQFVQFFLHEYSPEMRGTLRFQGTNPLVDMLFQMLSYPMTAYQNLVANGIHARGTIMTAGILTVLAGLEYFNRNAQRVLFSKDEEDRKLALEKLTRIPTQDDVIEIIGIYGTSSPLFGAAGSYIRDLVGNPILRAAGHDERNFPASPFRSPAIAMAQKAYGTLSRAFGAVGTSAREGDASKLQEAAGAVGGLIYDISPANALGLGQVGTAVSNVTDLYKMAALGSTEGSRLNMPGFANPDLVNASYFRSFGSDNPPQSLSEIQYEVLDQPLPQVTPESVGLPTSPMPQLLPDLATQPQIETPKPSAPSSPSEGLADRLN